jgi:RHS repeat-associated protein
MSKFFAPIFSLLILLFTAQITLAQTEETQTPEPARQFITVSPKPYYPPIIIDKSNPTGTVPNTPSAVNSLGITPPSPLAPPEVSVVNKVKDIPVNLYTATPIVGVPLYTLEEAGLKIPVNLNYNASGFNAHEVSPWTGANWTLNVNMITRVVKHLPDEGKLDIQSWTSATPRRGYYLYGGFVSSPNYSNEEDHEPDIYYLNLNGSSYKFMYSPQKQGFVFFPDADIKISVRAIISPNDNSNIVQQFVTWTVIMPDGIKYVFGQTNIASNVEESVEMESQWANANNVTPNYNNGRFQHYYNCNAVRSAWYLAKIETPYGHDINFDYVVGQYSFFKLAESEATGLCPTISKKVNQVFVFGATPQKIRGKTVEIEFNKGCATNNTCPETFRKDISDWSVFDNGAYTSKKLINMVVKQVGDTATVLKYKFDYDYFISAKSTELATNITQYGDVHLKRLKLNKITFPDGQKYTFNYWNEKDSTTFYGRLTYGIDHWGNLNGYNTVPVRGLIGVDEVSPNCNVASDGRETNATYAKYGLLKNMSSSLGSETIFDYEAHQAENFKLFDNITYRLIGGSRIKSITSKDLIRKTRTVKQYTYQTSDGKSSGVISLKPIYRHQDQVGNGYSNSSLYSQLFSEMNRPIVGYNFVKETSQDSSTNSLGHSDYYFDQPQKALTVKATTSNGGYYAYEPQYFKTQDDFRVGNLLKVEHYNQANQILTAQFNTYTSAYTADTNGIKIDSFYVKKILNINGLTLIGDPYYKYVRKFRTEETTQKTYSQTGTNPITQTTAYTYKDEMPQAYRDKYKGKHNQVVKITTTDSFGYPLETLTKYVGDFQYFSSYTCVDSTCYDSEIGTYNCGYCTAINHVPTGLTDSRGIYELIQKNMIAPVVEQVSKRNNKVVTASYQTFRQDSNVPSPFKYVPYQSFILDSLAKSNFTEVRFDSAQNDQTIKDLAYKPLIQGLFYGRYGQPTAVNVEYGLAYQLSYDTTGTLVTSIFRLAGNGNARVTTYEYANKVFGISKVTNDAIRTYYDYYPDGRLRQVRDNSDVVIKHFEYAYKGQLNVASGALVRDSTRNRVIARMPRIAVSDGASLSANSDSLEVDITYKDGYGRDLQQISHRGSPLKNDMIGGTNRVDNFERLYRAFLPVESSLKTGAIIDTATVLSKGQILYGDARPFAEKTQYEDSPISRILKMFDAGENWKTANKFEEDAYLTAGAGLRKYVKTPTGVDGTAKFTGYELFLQKSTDASGHTTLSYTDKEGRKIFERMVSNTSPTDTLTISYLYDDVGRVTHIISAKAYAATVSFLDNSDIAKQGVEIIKYDAKGRVSQKQVPNGGITNMVYNRLHQLVMVQNARQQLINQWSFSQYDAYGRVVKNGKITLNKSRDTLQKYFDAYYGVYDFSGYAGYRIFEVPSNTAALSYTNRSFPSQIAIADSNVMEVHYFDGYGTWQTTDIDFKNITLTGEFIYKKDLVADYPTGSKVRRLDDNTWLTSAIYYDSDRIRPVQIQSQNRFGGVNSVDVIYNFAGEKLSERTIYRKPNKPPVIVRKDFAYDHRGRVITQWSKIYSSNTQFTDTTGRRIIARYAYDGIGRLIQKQQGQFSNADTIVRLLPPNIRLSETARKWIELRYPSTTQELELTPANAGGVLYEGSINTLNGYLQVQNYFYHVHGGILGVNLDASKNPSLSGGNLWTYKLSYDYNTRISGQTWKTSTNPAGTYNYNYAFDGFSRLQSATYSNTSNGNENYSISGVSYDENGNLKTMQRRGLRRVGVYGLIDDLTYSYGSTGNANNQLNSVTDNVETVWGTNDFKDYNKSGNDYDYYPDGSLKADRNKGVTSIEYNYLGLTSKVTFNTSAYIENTYTADGIKISQKLVNGSQTVIMDYMGELLYRNDTLISVSHAEGKAVPDANGDNFDYQYFLTDFQGNIRYIYHQEGTSAIVLQESHFGPYGEVLYGIDLKGDWKFLYQGKEYVDLLNAYDFMWRQYDQTIGRFTTIDPDGQFASGYVGMGNLPHMTIDPNGRWVHLLVGAIIGGAVNVYQNWDVIVKAGKGGNTGAAWAKAAGFFGVGAVEGLVMAAIPGAGIAKYGATFVAAVGTGAFKNTGNALLGGHFDFSPKNILTNAAFATGATAVISKVAGALAPLASKLASRAMGWFRDGAVYLQPTANTIEGLLKEGLTEEAAQKIVGTVMGGGQEVVAESGKMISLKGFNAGAGAMKNLSGNLDDAAALARNQPYGSNTNVFRRLPNSPQDVQALAEAQAGMGRKLDIRLGDPRYKGWEKWHHSVGQKGSKSVVHYLRNPETGFLTDFKFK